MDVFEPLLQDRLKAGLQGAGRGMPGEGRCLKR